ncbi:MAG: M12 family metallopeptidase [Bacteroidales bacterium]|nr:M12 family metallopeptidase [Bacteroidales bacterium]
MKLMTCAFLILPVISMLNLQAQDYLISFVGSGASTTVTTVKVENLTQGTCLSTSGSDVLHLMGVVTGIEIVSDNETGKIDIYPNPMKDYARMQFVLPETGETMITMYDLSGRKIVQTRDLLSKGQHIYGIQGVEEGIYFVRINSGRYSFSGRLISSGSQNRNAKIVYENTMAVQEKESDAKGTNAETVMQYNTGDRLKLTGISGDYSTVITDVPTASKTITFKFIACTDGDINNYPVVEIGTQVWMAENLKTTKYQDGTTIPNKTDNTEWNNLTSGAYCDYDNLSPNSNTYGRLYNWYAINDSRNIAPQGWHIPSDDEWATLAVSLGGIAIAGGKMKESGTTHWNSPNEGATNESGFTALPAGGRLEGTFIAIGLACAWWSTTEYNATNAWFRELDNDAFDLLHGDGSKKNGFSVRCLKDQPKAEEAFPGIEGEIKDFVVNGDTITCEIIDTVYVFQGDIILTKDQLSLNKGAGLSNISKRWLDGIVYYEINSNLPQKIRDYIDTAIKNYEDNTTLRFVKKGPDQKNFVEFFNSETLEGLNYGTCSYLGMIEGKQRIWLEPSWNKVGTIIHEIGHTVGLIHEHSRTDRDNYVIVNLNNVEPGEEHNFNKVKTQFITLKFDFNSIMLYYSYEFSCNNLPTITNLDGTIFEYNRDFLSLGDIKVINSIYSPDRVLSIWWDGTNEYYGVFDLGTVTLSVLGTVGDLKWWTGSCFISDYKLYAAGIPTSQTYKLYICDLNSGTLLKDYNVPESIYTAGMYNDKPVLLWWDGSHGRYGLFDLGFGTLTTIGSIGDLTGWTGSCFIYDSLLYVAGVTNSQINKLYVCNLNSGELVNEYIISTGFFTAGMYNKKPVLVWSDGTYEYFGLLDLGAGNLSILGTIGDLTGWTGSCFIFDGKLYAAGITKSSTYKLYVCDLNSGALLKDYVFPESIHTIAGIYGICDY